MWVDQNCAMRWEGAKLFALGGLRAFGTRTKQVLSHVIKIKFELPSMTMLRPAAEILEVLTENQPAGKMPHE